MLLESMDRQVKQCLPELFEGRYRSVLYVGANKRRQHFLDDFMRAYDRIVVLELDDGNVKFLTEKFKDTEVQIVPGDVRDMDESAFGRFDVCFFYHGPEHLSEDETADVLGRLESVTEHVVVLGMPYGHYEQDAEYGNVYEKHLWHIYPKDVEKLGYVVDTIGKPDDRSSNMIAWKRTDPA